MDILSCPKCRAQLRPDDTYVIKMRTGAARYQERECYCSYCHTVLSIEVTMGEDDSETLSQLSAIEL
jgi:uncharacterized protein YbaR (Trm112 family)